MYPRTRIFKRPDLMDTAHLALHGRFDTRTQNLGRIKIRFGNLPGHTTQGVLAYKAGQDYT